MKKNILFVFLLISTQLYAQKNINIPITTKGDTSYWYKYSQGLTEKLKRPNLQNTPNDFYFRFVYVGRPIITAVDVFKLKDSTFKSIITFYTIKCEDYNRNKKVEKKIFLKSFELNADNSLKLYQIIIPKNILSISSEEYIKGWSQGLDGETFIIEYANKTLYTLKSYWAPSTQESILEAKIIQEFSNELMNFAAFKTIEKEFFQKIPFSCYTAGGATAGVKIEPAKNK